MKDFKSLESTWQNEAFLLTAAKEFTTQRFAGQCTLDASGILWSKAGLRVRIVIYQVLSFGLPANILVHSDASEKYSNILF